MLFCYWWFVCVGYLVVDDKEYTGQSSGRHVGLDLSQRMFLGGTPDYRMISSYVDQRTGFIGTKLYLLDVSILILCTILKCNISSVSMLVVCQSIQDAWVAHICKCSCL